VFVKRNPDAGIDRAHNGAADIEMLKRFRMLDVHLDSVANGKFLWS